jgi:hypothetical protein
VSVTVPKREKKKSEFGAGTKSLLIRIQKAAPTRIGNSAPLPFQSAAEHSPRRTPAASACRRLPHHHGPGDVRSEPPSPPHPRGEETMDHHLPQQQQYGGPYRTLVPSPQPDHHIHGLQYHHQPQPTLMSQSQQQSVMMSPPQPPPVMMSPPQPQPQQHASLASHFHLLHVSNYYNSGYFCCCCRAW